MEKLLKEIRQCTVCLPHLEAGVNPILSVHRDSKVAIIGQAPGSKVHRTSIPWDDSSGVRLREWLGVSEEVFYNPKNLAIVPMGFCYPGKGKSGDLPPRKECAPLWHEKILEHAKDIKLTLLIGSYAQKYYLGEKMKKTLTETVKSFEDYWPTYLPLPHPSPRNNIWLKKNPWFQSDLLPILKDRIAGLL